MPERIPEALQEKLAKRLTFYQDIGIQLFYHDRYPQQLASVAEEIPLPKPAQKTQPVKPVVETRPMPPKLDVFPAASGPSLFEAINKIPDDTLLKIRTDLGDCARCKLHRGRTKLVFGDGNPKAELVFVGEGPGRDEDAQGLPFVGRAGKLLTQMIEAMGLQRQDAVSYTHLTLPTICSV